MHNICMFSHPSAYTLEVFEDCGADSLPQYKPYPFDRKMWAVASRAVLS